MKQLTISLVSLFILFNGCSSEDIKIKNTFNGEEIRSYVYEALEGNEAANVKLSYLYDYSLTLPLKANKIEIDSLQTISGSVVYIVLAEHENPFYNRLAIYNNKLRLLLIDKSLNGYLSLSQEAAGKPVVRVNEQFLSKDIIQLNRVSLYLVEDTTAALCFRSFTGMVRNNKEFKQTIDEMSEQKIKTSISVQGRSPLNKKEDIFTFNEELNKYTSTSDIFNKFVLEDIRTFSVDVKMPQITDAHSAMESIRVTSGNDDTILNTSNFGGDGFGLTLSETWKELRNVSISSYINKEVKGARYINNNLGASIYVIPLAPEDSAEMHIASVLNHKSEGKYKVRYSEKTEAGKNFIQYFEYSCGAKKYLLILETSKYTYEEYKDMYSEIISTFFMEC